MDFDSQLRVNLKHCEKIRLSVLTSSFGQCTLIRCVKWSSNSNLWSIYGVVGQLKVIFSTGIGLIDVIIVLIVRIKLAIKTIWQ